MYIKAQRNDLALCPHYTLALEHYVVQNSTKRR